MHYKYKKYDKSFPIIICVCACVCVLNFTILKVWKFLMLQGCWPFHDDGLSHIEKVYHKLLWV